jgi:hypothetical protein
VPRLRRPARPHHPSLALSLLRVGVALVEGQQVTPRIYEGHPNAVPVGPLRDHFIKAYNRGEIAPHDVARQMGWIHAHSGRPDTSRALRALGLREKTARGGSPKRYITVLEYETAVRLAEAIGMDPHEAGV